MYVLFFYVFYYLYKYWNFSERIDFLSFFNFDIIKLYIMCLYVVKTLIVVLNDIFLSHFVRCVCLICKRLAMRTKKRTPSTRTVDVYRFTRTTRTVYGVRWRVQDELTSVAERIIYYRIINDNNAKK